MDKTPLGSYLRHTIAMQYNKKHDMASAVQINLKNLVIFCSEYLLKKFSINVIKPGLNTTKVKINND